MKCYISKEITNVKTFPTCAADKKNKEHEIEYILIAKTTWGRISRLI